MSDDYWVFTTYKCDCVKPMIDSLFSTLLPLDDVTEMELTNVSPSGQTGTELKYKVAGSKKIRSLIIEHTFCPFCGKRLDGE